MAMYSFATVAFHVKVSTARHCPSASPPGQSSAESQVTDIIPTGTADEPMFKIETNSTEMRFDDFDAVFFAAPWHSSPVSKRIAANFTEPIP